jgi:hypothetical protein
MVAPVSAWPGLFLAMQMTEKITERIDLHLPLTMKHDIQDAAMAEDRKVSDYIRHVLACHLYWVKNNCTPTECNAAMRGE